MSHSLKEDNGGNTGHDDGAGYYAATCVADKVAAGNAGNEAGVQTVVRGEERQMHLELEITDKEVIAALESLPMGTKARQEFALAALKIGVLSLHHAGSQLDGELIRKECDSLLVSTKHELEMWTTNLSTQLNQAFSGTGTLHQQLERFTNPGTGSLAVVLQAFDQMLIGNLEKRMEPLLYHLDPKSAGNLVQRLTQASKEATLIAQEGLLQAFSLDNPTSVLSRLVRELKSGNVELNLALNTSVAEVGRQLSLDNPDSALSRLRKELLDVVRLQDEQATRFQSDVRANLATMIARKEESLRGTQHGLTFESAVINFLQTNGNPADIVTSTGSIPGIVKNCKVGDAVIELGPDRIGAGCRIVVEAKESSSYDLAKAREEIGVGRKNRKALVGLFVFSVLTAPKDMLKLQRLGQDIFLVWNAEEAECPYFRAALLLTTAMCAKEAKQRTAEAADFTKLDDALACVEKEATRFGEISKWAETIQSSSIKIIDQARRSTANMEKTMLALRDAVEGLREGGE
jgi:hypothetical protein